MRSRSHYMGGLLLLGCLPVVLWACNGQDTGEETPSNPEPVAERTGQAAQAVSVAGTGCSDGTREGFTAYPNSTIAGCSGGWSLPGIMLDNPGHPSQCPNVTTYDTVTPTCGRNAGNSSANPNGSGCDVADLCAVGWHVCQTAQEVALNSPTGDCSGALVAGDPTPLFFAARQSSDGCDVCATGTSTVPACDSATCEGGCEQTQYLSNDLFGCGNIGSTGLTGCGALDVASGNECGAIAGAGWSCNDGDGGFCEAYVVTHANDTQGGVLCCQDASVCTTIQRCQGGNTADAVIAPWPYANTSFPTTPGMWVGNSGTVSGNESLFWFDLSGIPNTATVSTATLTLKSPSVVGSPSPTDQVDLQEILSSSSWWTAPPATLTWNAFGGTLAGVTTAIPLVHGVPRVIALPATIVQGWVAIPSSNLGLALVLDPSSNPAVGEGFRSSEWAPCNDEPALQVCYTP
jgi:hypothetical protein